MYSVQKCYILKAELLNAKCLKCVKIIVNHLCLGEAVQELSDAFSDAYDGSVVVAVVGTDVAHTRRAPRSVSTKDDIGVKT